VGVGAARVRWDLVGIYRPAMSESDDQPLTEMTVSFSDANSDCSKCNQRPESLMRRYYVLGVLIEWAPVDRPDLLGAEAILNPCLLAVSGCRPSTLTLLSGFAGADQQLVNRRLFMARSRREAGTLDFAGSHRASRC